MAWESPDVASSAGLELELGMQPLVWLQAEAASEPLWFGMSSGAAQEWGAALAPSGTGHGLPCCSSCGSDWLLPASGSSFLP